MEKHKIGLGVTHGLPVEKGSVTTSHLANALPPNRPADDSPATPAVPPATNSTKAK